MATLSLTLREVAVSDEDLLRDLFAADRPPVLLDRQYAARAVSYAQAWPDSSDRVIEVDGEPVGRILVGHGAAEWRLVDIAVLPDHRNQGIGSAVLRRVADEASAAGMPLSLHVDHDNPATRLYLREGFVLIAGGAVQNLMRREVQS